MLTGAMGTAVKDTIRLHTMTDDPATAVRAGWRQRVDCTLKAIEDMRLTSDPQLKTFIVHIPTHFTSLIVPLLIHHFPLSLIYPF
jgi:hypothetical protein